MCAAQRRRKCAKDGCEVMVLNVTGYCQEHQLKHRKCLVDECQNMVTAYNRSGCCYEHRLMGRKLRP